MDFMEYMRFGGSIMWVILGLSVIALAVAIERVWFFVSAGTDPEALELAFAQAVAARDLEGVRRVVSGKSSMQRLFSVAYTHWMIDQENMKLLLAQQIRRELYRWERYLSLMEITARVSPLLGLLGTVLGMVQMFQSMHLGSGVSAEAVTGGIWKALFTTVAGLAVAIPVIIVHGVLIGKIDKQEEMLERGADFLLREHYNSRIEKT